MENATRTNAAGTEVLINDVLTLRSSNERGSSATVESALPSAHNQERGSHRSCATNLEAPAEYGGSVPEQK
jgi:hypothetical protein